MSEISNILNGYAFKSANYVDDGIRIIRIANVQDGEIIDENPCFYPADADDSLEKYKLIEGDILVSLTGNVGRVGILPKSMIPAALNQRVCCVRIDEEKVNRKYLFYYLRQYKFTQDCINASKGVAQLNLSTKWLAEYEILLPKLSEQQRIVERIEEMFSQLDSAVETLKKTKQQLAVYRQAVLKEAFEGNLTKLWRIINSYENEWKEVNIGYLIQNDKCALKAGPFGSSLKKDCYVPNGYKIYGQEQVISGNENFGDYYINEQKYQELFSCRIKPYDVLISLVGTVGKVLILSEHCQPGIINPRLIKISLDKEKMIPKFFKYYFESDYLRSLYKSKVHGATMDVLNKGMIKELPFAWCPLEEQNKVVEEIESRLSICDNIEKTVDTALQQAEAIRQSILKKAFEGTL